MTADPRLLADALLTMKAIDAEWQGMRANVQAFYDAVNPPAPNPSNVIRVTAGQHLQGVIDAAPPGSVLALEPAVYAGTIVLTKPVTIQPTAVVASGRVTSASPGGVFLTSAEVDGTVILKGAQASLLGLGVQSSNPDAELVVIQPSALGSLLDQCAIVGDPVRGQRRGIRAEGAGMAITRCRITDIWRSLSSNIETQGIGGSVGCRDLLIEDCYIEGACQAVMFGGTDSGTEALMPTNIRITHSTLTKQPSWYAKPAKIKNALELKAVLNFSMSDCILEYAGNAEGQGSYLIVLTPRNQDGKAPWSRVENVTIERIYGRYAGGCIATLGHDDEQLSGPLKDIAIRNAFFSNIDPQGVWKGSGRAIFMDNGGQNVTFEHLNFQAVHMGAGFYAGGTPPVGLKITDVQLPQATWGQVKIDAGSGGNGSAGWAVLQQYATDAVLDMAAGPGATGYPQP